MAITDTARAAALHLPALTATALLLAAPPASANRLLSESWLPRASYAQVTARIEAGDSIDALHRHGYTPLMLAARRGNLAAARALLDAGADPRQADDGWGPMHYAADGDMVALLFEYGASVRDRTDDDSTPLHIAAGDNRTGAMQALIRRGADIEAGAGPFDKTPLYQAAKMGGTEAAELLIAAGADVNRSSLEGMTPLHIAAKQNSAAMAELLIAAGADIEAVAGQFKKTPLHYAAKQNSAAMAALLLDAGADPAARDRDNATPADFAAKNRKLRGTKVLARLQAAVAEPPEAADCDGWRVQPGDRALGDIAAQALGDRSRWPEIARLNDIEGTYRIGQCLRLPS